MFVNVDVTKALPRVIMFKKNGKEFTAEFIYLWLPSRCSLCDKWGHKEEVRVIKKKETEETREVTTPKSQNNCGSREKKRSAR